MNYECPYCHNPIAGEMAAPPVSRRKRRIYNAVVSAGNAGIKAKDLLAHMYGGEQESTPGGPVVLRVMICEMNKVIAKIGQRISAIDGSYFLFSKKGKKWHDR